MDAQQEKIVLDSLAERFARICVLLLDAESKHTKRLTAELINLGEAVKGFIDLGTQIYLEEDAIQESGLMQSYFVGRVEYHLAQLRDDMEAKK